MIRLQNITKYYDLKGGGRHYVMKNLSLDIPPNKNIAILGPNGAGKSTLLRMIGGAESPNEGKIITDAHISWPLGVSAGFQGSLTARENIQFVCRINGLSVEETAQTIESVQEFAEIGKFFDQAVKSYSSGMRARIAFGLSIVFDFDYYLIDELTSVGDAAFRQKALLEFEKIKKRASLIFVSHSLKMLQQSCDSVILLNQGNATYYEDIKDGLTEYQKLLPPEKRTLLNKKNPSKKTAAKKTVAKKAASKKTPSKKIAQKKAASTDAPKSLVTKPASIPSKNVPTEGSPTDTGSK